MTVKKKVQISEENGIDPPGASKHIFSGTLLPKINGGSWQQAGNKELIVD